MSATLNTILWGFFNPGNLLFGLLILALLLSWWHRSRRLGIGLGAMMLAVIAVLGALPLRDWLVTPLEQHFPVPALPERIAGIVVLGGAEEPALYAAHGWPEVNSNADRLIAFAALARRYPEARLIFTGGAALPKDGRLYTEADVAAAVFALLGLDPARVQYDAKARNTVENARFAKEIAGPVAGETWLLVTSARHMPRAINCFNALDWPMLPYPVDYIARPRQGLAFEPLRNLSGLSSLTKEWIGLLVYRLTGQTRDFLPPRPAATGETRNITG
ncbi:YdcF family protein [Ferrovibrio sp.]|uniref:YdcF family protein n=1 Tax=Ferrovibrio sp. TaxID=1917215 RepID=UPI002622ED9E|nr:YdcF family protein [Ferrovibrio sp.]